MDQCGPATGALACGSPAWSNGLSDRLINEVARVCSQINLQTHFSFPDRSISSVFMKQFLPKSNSFVLKRFNKNVLFKHSLNPNRCDRAVERFVSHSALAVEEEPNEERADSARPVSKSTSHNTGLALPVRYF